MVPRREPQARLTAPFLAVSTAIAPRRDAVEIGGSAQIREPIPPAEVGGILRQPPKSPGISGGFLILFPSRVHPARVSPGTRKTRPFLTYRRRSGRYGDLVLLAGWGL